MAESVAPLRSAVRIPLGRDHLLADLVLPMEAPGIVVFAHGSGSGRKSPRNRYVAGQLERQHLGTLLVDLLTETEAREDQRTSAHRFDIPLLSRRLVSAIDWLGEDPDRARRRIGLYGASTGGAAALFAAAARPERVSALVLRGARSDLASEAAPKVEAPCLFVVGSRDPEILEMNRETARRLLGPHALTVVPEATHLFEEPGALAEVAKATTDWFGRYLSRAPSPSPG